MANYVYADTNTDLDLTFETENLGEISASGTTADYGSLTATPTNLLANTPLLAESDIDGDRGEIVNQSISPMGAVASMTSTTNEAFARTSYLGSGNIAASGIAGQSLKRIWIGSGTIFEISDGMERSSAFWLGSGGATFDGAAVETFNASYNTDSDLLLSDEDYGTIEPLHEGYLQNQKALLGQALYFPTPDGGSITEPFSEGEEDYGSIVFGQRRRTVHDIETVEAARGKFTLGERKETGLRYQTRTTATGIPDMPINRYEWVGSGFSHIIGGEVSERYKPTFGQTGSGLFAVTGGANEAYSNKSQGAFRNSSGSGFKRISTLDHGRIHLVPFVISTFTIYPQPDAIERQTDSWLGSGSLFSLGGAVETATFHQSQDSVNLFSTEDYDLIIGTAPNPDVDFGTTTEGIPQGAVDHGHIGFSEDVFGGTGGPRVFYVRDLWTQEEIDQKLTINPQYVTPETGLVPQVGVEKTQEESEDVQYKPIFGQFGTGLFSVSGTATEKVVISGALRGSAVFPGQLISSNNPYIHTRRPSQPRLGKAFLYNIRFWNPNYPLAAWHFDIAGEKQTDDYVGSGSLFSVGGAAESATFDYNEDTVVTFTTDDNGLITATGSIVDHGSITNPLTAGEEDNGSIVNTFTVSAVTGSLFAVGGAAESTTTNPPEDTYLFSVVGQGIEKQTDDYVGSGSATLSGSGLDAVVFREIFSGTLSSVGGAAEAVAVDYNLSSIVTFATPVDNGLITGTAPNPDIDYGSITNPLTEGIEDLGSVIYSQTVQGTTGGITFAYQRPSWTQAEIDERLNINPDYVTPETGLVPVDGQEKSQEEAGDVQFKPIFGQIGSGSLFAIGGAVEVVAQTDDTFGLFTLFTAPAFIGNTYRFCWNAPFVEGGLFSIGGAAESATWDYNESSIVVVTTTDNGLITNSVQTTEDNGSVASPLTDGEENNGTIVNTVTTYPLTGTLATSGVAETPFTRRFIGSGSINTFSGQALVEKVTFAQESTYLFNIVGTTAYARTRPYIGSGIIPSVGGGVEKVTFDYGEQVVFTSDDYGNITATTTVFEDSGLVSDPLTAGEEDYNTILYNQTVQPYAGGTGPIFTFSYTRQPLTQEEVDQILAGNPDYVTPETGLVPQAGDIKTQEQARDVKFEPIFSQIGSGSLFSFGGAVEAVAQTDDTFGLFNVSGSTAFSRTRPYIGSGSLFTLNGAAEAVTWDYNETSIDVVTTEDYGNVVDAVTTTDDYGSVTETTTAGEFTYGTVVNTSTTFPLTGSYVVSGNSVERSIIPETGGGSIFTFSGQSQNGVDLIEKVGFAEEATGLFDIIGVAQTPRTRDYVGTGSLFGLSGCAEAVTWDYNETSIDVFSTEDNGLISSTATVLEDNGLISDPLTAGEENNGTVINTATTYPLTGTIDLAGVSENAKTNIFTGSGSLFTASGAAEVFVLDYESTYLFTVVGTTTFSRSRDYIGSGSLFSIGGCVEKVTFDYNDSSVVVFSSTDNDLIIALATVNEDNGSIVDPLTAGEENNGTVLYDQTVTGTTGGITLSGEAVDVFAPIFAEVGSGSIFTVGGAAEVVAQTDETTGLFSLSTSPAFIGNTYRFCWKYDAFGTLPVIGGAAESRTYDYSDELVLPFVQEDNGLVSAAATTNEDDGSINLPTTAGEEDNGSILNTVITPAQGTYTVSGEIQVAARSVYIGSGTLFTAGGAAEVVAQTDDTTGLFTVSGVATILRSHAYNGSGTLNALSGAAESRSWVYDRNLPALTSEDYGSVDSNATSNEDQGQITSVLTNGEEDYGTTSTDPAHGTYTISGVAVTPFERRYIGSGSYGGFSGTAIERFARFGEIDGAGTIELFTAPAFIGNTYRFTFRFAGSGSLFTASGVSESTTTNPPERTILFTGSGTAVEKQTDRYIGSGNLFTAGGVAETVTVNEAATGLFTVSGVGIEKQTDDYIGSGSATLSGTATERATQDYIGDTAQYTLSGNAVERQTDDYVGSGSLFTASGSAEAITSNPPEDTALFAIGGSKAESFTPATEIGSGSLFTVGGLGESVTVNEAATGLYTISGQVVFNYIVSHIGSGSLFTTGGAAESKTTNVPENTILFTATGTVEDSTTVIAVVQGGTLSTFSGQSLIERVAVAEEDTTLYTFSGAVEFIYRVRFPGSGNLFTAGGAAEAVGVVEESTGLYQLQGTGNEAFGRATYIGSGSYGGFSGTRVSEKHTEAYLGDAPQYTWSGFATLSVEYHYDGFGNLFTASGASESITTNPPEDTALFTVAGTTGDPTIVKDYVGSGSYGGFSGTCVEKVAQADEMGGTITLSGDVIFNIKYMPVVGGNIFTFGGAAERVTSNPPENIALFALGGTKDEAFIRAPYIGSGSYGGFSGSAIEKHTERYVGDVAEFTLGGGALRVFFLRNNIGSGSIFVTGDGVEKQTDREVGSGNLFTAGGAIEVTVTNPPESTVLFTATGESIEKHTERYVGSGSATLSGSAVEKHSNGEVGSGSLFTVGGAAESVTFNEAATGLYGFSGVVGESFIANPPESTAQITLSGEADDRQLDNYTGTGVMDFLEGGAAVTFAEEKVAFSPDATGLFTLSGESTSAVVRPHIGSGTISTFSGQAINEKVTFADDETLQIQLSGESVSKFTGSHVGSGSLFTTGGAAESKTTNEAESIILFRITGTADTPRARTYTGSGSISITGSTVERALRAHTATGSLFAFNGVADTVTFNYSATGLFGVSGGANEAFIRLGYQGSGSTTISGTSDESQTDRYVGDTAQYNISGAATEIRFIPHYKGSGSLFTTGGVAVLIAQTDDTTGLFEISHVRERWTQAEVDEQLRINSNYVTPETGLAPVAGDEKTQEQSGDVRYIPIAAHIGSGTVNLDGTADEEFRKFEPGFTFVTII